MVRGHSGAFSGGNPAASAGALDGASLLSSNIHESGLRGCRTACSHVDANVQSGQLPATAAIPPAASCLPLLGSNSAS